VLNLGKYVYLCALILLFGFSLNASAQGQRVDIALDAQKIGADETVILTVRAVGMDEELDTSNLETDFDVNRRSSSRQVNIINGQRTSIVEWILELTPKRSGVLTIEPIQVGSQASRTAILMVDEPATGSNRELFVETSVDVLDPYVQAQVIYTVKVYQDVRLLDGSLSVPDTDLALIQQIGEDTSFRETVEGREYAVVQRRYSVFPRKSGPLELPQVVLQATVAIDRAISPNTRTRTRRVTRRSNIITLDVQPRPQASDGSWWLPASQILLGSEWSTPIDQLQVDEPVTRIIRLQASGVAGTQLPDIPVPSLDNISIYADSPTSNTDTSGNNVIAEQVITWAVIPQQTGELELPEIRVEWFDTQARESKVAILPAEVLNVVGDSVVNPSPETQSDDATAVPRDADASNVPLTANNEAEVDNTQSPIQIATDVDSTNLSNQFGAGAEWWRNVAMLALLGWALSIAGLWYWYTQRAKNNAITGSAGAAETARQRFIRRAAAPASLDRVTEACGGGNPSKIAHAILGWGTMIWPDNPPTHIQDVANRLNSSELHELFAELDARQYGGSTVGNSSVNSVTMEAIPGLIQSAVKQLEADDAKTTDGRALPAL
jgi:hypothetical protein